MRVKVKTVEEINDFLSQFDFEKNINKDVLEHLKREECPYCATPVYLKQGDMRDLNYHALVKRLCHLSKNKRSYDVKNSVHIIFKTENGEVVFNQSSGVSDGFVYED